MALLNESTAIDLHSFFQDDPSLGKLLLKDVKFTGRNLGKGSFGSVEEVSE